MKYQAICVFNQLLDVMDSIQIAVNVKHRVVFQCNIPFMNKERKGLDRYMIIPQRDQAVPLIQT